MIRRLTRRVERLDRDVSQWERHVAGIRFSGSNEYAKRMLEFASRQRDEAWDELETLLRRMEAVETE
jgi:hypothetical protein